MLGQIPGSNLLNAALRVIASQTVTYYQYQSRANNAAGKLVTTYAAPIDVKGSFQAVPRNVYQQWGLDFQKNYMVFYVSKNVIDINRNVSGDQLSFAGRKYQCESVVPWYGIDGWVGVTCVDVGAA